MVLKRRRFSGEGARPTGWVRDIVGVSKMVVEVHRSDKKDRKSAFWTQGRQSLSAARKGNRQSALVCYVFARVEGNQAAAVVAQSERAQGRSTKILCATHL
jgi:hypothetical protein